MKKFILLMALVASPAFASESKHTVSLGSQGLGFSGERETIKGESRSPFENVTRLVLDVSVNYAYAVSPRLQVGARFSNENHEMKYKNDDGSTSPAEQEYQTFGAFVLYNLKDDLRDSYVLGVGVSWYNLVEEISHDFADNEGKVPIETDDQGWVYELTFGKRFTLAEWNLENLSYAPQIGVFHRTHTKDFDDQKIRKGFGLSFDFVKFDFFF